MMNNNFLDGIEMPDFWKAFSVSLCRMIAEKPRVLLLLEDNNGVLDCKDLYDKLQDEKLLKEFSKNIYDLAKSYNWSTIENAYSTWGRYGWVADSLIVPIDFWGKCPASQTEADALVMRSLNRDKFLEIKTELVEMSKNRRLYEEAITCFNNKCYTACASLLIALIDGELIRCKASSIIANKKTGFKAGKRLVTIKMNDDAYGLPGYFHLELLNYESFISTLFESANGFVNEPQRLNRNFLHHGMAKRKVLRRDCIKLLLAYHKTIRITEEA